MQRQASYGTQHLDMLLFSCSQYSFGIAMALGIGNSFFSTRGQPVRQLVVVQSESMSIVMMKTIKVIPCNLELSKKLIECSDDDLEDFPTDLLSR